MNRGETLVLMANVSVGILSLPLFPWSIFGILSFSLLGPALWSVFVVAPRCLLVSAPCLVCWSCFCCSLLLLWFLASTTPCWSSTHWVTSLCTFGFCFARVDLRLESPLGFLLLHLLGFLLSQLLDFFILLLLQCLGFCLVWDSFGNLETLAKPLIEEAIF